jgi:hypothetical protein
VSAPRLRRSDRALLASAGVLTAFLLAQLLAYGYGRDQGIYAVVADAILHGGAPYRDAWDFKPPGIHLVFAAARAALGSDPLAIRVVEAAALLSLFPAFAILARRAVGLAAPGGLGAAVAILAYVPLEFWNTAQPEGFAAVALAWALVLATSAPPGGPLARAAAAGFGAGALYGAAALGKPTLAAGAAVSLAFALAEPRGEGERRGPRALALVAAYGAGTALAPALAVAWLHAHGALGDAADALLRFAPRYTALGLAGEGAGRLVVRALGWWLSPLAPYNVIGLLLLVALPPLAPRERRLAAQVLGVVLSTLLGVALQAKFFGYHFAPALVLTGFLAGLGLWKLWLRLRERPLAAVAAAALLALASQVEVRGLPSVRAFWARTPARLTAWLDRERWPEVADRLHSGDDVDARANRAAAAWLARHTPADATLFVFGFEPVLYDLSERAPASRYVYNVPQRAAWSAAAHRAVLLRELAARPPAAVVVVHGDPLPAVTGDALDSAAALAGFPELARWLDEGYAQAARFGDLEIFMRRS